MSKDCNLIIFPDGKPGLTGAPGSSGSTGATGATGATGSQGVDSYNKVNHTFAGAGNPYLTLANSTGSYITTTGGFFIFPGTAEFTPTTFHIVVGATRSTVPVSIKISLEDVTNTTTIATTSVVIPGNLTVIDMGSLFKLPSAEAIFEIKVIHANSVNLYTMELR